MINYTYQLVSPQVFSIKYDDICLENRVLIRPQYMALCHADQRYYQGKRDHNILKKKLPMALVHECCGEVIYDPSNQFRIGEMVVPIPNVPQKKSDIIYENYMKGSKFLSSGYDGFMREYVDMPVERVVSVDGINPRIAAITEFISVVMHATTRFDHIAHEIRDIIGIWGDGSMGYCVATVLKSMFPQSKILVVGHNQRKLSYFSFADETYLSDALPSELKIDHAFECCGGEGSYYAINDIIKYINPQGTLMLMGVSENKVSINTRDMLEKGITSVGCSRSGKKDFEKASKYMRDYTFQKRIESIIYEDDKVMTIDDIHRVFRTDMNTSFKTVFKWEI